MNIKDKLRSVTSKQALIGLSVLALCCLSYWTFAGHQEHKWYVVTPGINSCINAKWATKQVGHPMSTPWAFRSYLKTDTEGYQGMEVLHLHHSLGEVVKIQVEQQDNSIHTFGFFSKQIGCLATLGAFTEEQNSK